MGNEGLVSRTHATHHTAPSCLHLCSLKISILCAFGWGGRPIVLTLSRSQSIDVCLLQSRISLPSYQTNMWPACDHNNPVLHHAEPK